MPVAPPFDDYANHVKDALRTAEFVVDADLDPGDHLSFVTVMGDIIPLVLKAMG